MLWMFLAYAEPGLAIDDIGELMRQVKEKVIQKDPQIRELIEIISKAAPEEKGTT